MGTCHPSESERAEHPSRLAAIVLLLGVLVIGVHFTATALYVMPLNPLKLALMRPLGAYMEPQFAQGWSLFAPDPLTDSPFLLYSCRVSSHGTAMEHGPFDASTALYVAHHEQRITPAFRLRRAQVAAQTLTHPPRDPLADAISTLDAHISSEVRAAARSIVEGRADSYERGERIFARVASVECRRRFPSATITDVKVSIQRQKHRKFSERQQSDVQAPVTRHDFDWAPFESVSGY